MYVCAVSLYTGLGKDAGIDLIIFHLKELNKLFPSKAETEIKSNLRVTKGKKISNRSLEIDQTIRISSSGRLALT